MVRILRTRKICFSFKYIVKMFHSIPLFFMVVGNCTGQTEEPTVAFPPRLPALTWMANLQELSLLGALKMWHLSPLILRSKNSTGQSAAREWYVPHFSLLSGSGSQTISATFGASKVALVIKNPPTNAGDMEEMWVQSLGW